jgi:hypothetical protein
MNDNRSVTAVFIPNGPFSLNISVNGNGSVTSPGTGIQGPYNCSEVVGLIAEVDPGYAFISWGGNNTTIANPGYPSTNFTMYDNYSITANFGLLPTSSFGDANGDGNISIMDYSAVRQMLFGKRAFNPGGDADQNGILNILDYSYVRLMLFGKKPVVDKYEVSYDFLSGAGSNRWAKINTISSTPPANHFDNESGWTAATTTDYNNISLTDSNIWSIAGTPGNYSALQCKFALVEIPSSITSIGVTLNGSSNINGSTLRFWSWNFSSSSWTQIGSFSMTTTIASHSSWTAWDKVYANYINGSNMFILASLNTSAADLNIDYIKLSVAHP